MKLKLNCDLGESFGAWRKGADESVMPFLDQANIACGFHAGDPVVMQATLALAKQYGVQTGAHPSYPDLAGFGRRSMACSKEEIVAFMHYQIAALDGIALSQNMQIAYVKTHGALYNDMMLDTSVRHAVFQAVSEYHRPLTLMIQATPEANLHSSEAAEYGLTLWFEAFADRRYNDDGHLLSRSESNAVLDYDGILIQVKQLIEKGSVITVSGKELPIHAHSLCVHGDNKAAIKAVKSIRGLLDA